MSGETNQVRWRGVRPVAGIGGVWPAIGAVRVQEHDTQSGAGTKVVYTVPGNKKFFLSSAILASRLTVGAEVRANALVRDAGDAIKYYLGAHVYTQPGQMTTHSNFFPALELPAGWDVCLYVQAVNQYAWYDIFGWLEDA